MTDQTTAPPNARFGGFWSLSTNYMSTTQGRVNFWAMLETAAAVAAFWWVTLAQETWAIFYPSLIAAPILLLRSNESVKQGVFWFENGLFAQRQVKSETSLGVSAKSKTRSFIVGAVVGLMSAGVILYVIFKRKLITDEQVLRFVLVIMALTVLIIAFSILGALIAHGADDSTPVDIVDNSATLSHPIIINQPSDLGITVLCPSRPLAPPGYDSKAEHYTIYTFLIPFFMAAGFAAAVTLFGLICRIAATARHFSRGLEYLPDNLSNLCLRSPPLAPPEVLPGLDDASIYSVIPAYKRYSNRFRTIGLRPKIVSSAMFLFLSIWFVPRVIYRFSLKSTAWLWWVLSFLGMNIDSNAKIQDFVVDKIEKLHAKLSTVTALMSIGSFVLLYYVIPYFGYILEDSAILPIAALFVVVDWRNVALLPALNALAALSTLGLVIWIDSVAKDASVSRDISKQLPWLSRAARLKAGLGWATIALTMLYLALFANAQHSWLPVSHFAQQQLEWVYGRYAGALVPK